MNETRSHYGHMVHEYYVRRLRELAKRRDARLADLHTRSDVQHFQKLIRAKLRASFGPPPERTPLCSRITGTLMRSDYSIEKLIFQSRPRYFVTANLYRPKGVGPFPAVLGTCGHSSVGKAYDAYQRFARGLAQQGYLVLICDPVSQGERLQYSHATKALRPNGCVHEHNMAGKQLGLAGEFFGTWRLWDGIRALDYLLSRPEVDSRRVGVTGNSGGGTLTTYLTAMDERFTMAAPSCFVTTYLSNLESELPADSEQIPPGILAAGLDIGDFFIARAPRPTLLIGQEQDYFDVRGLRKTFEQLKRIYAILGAPDAIQLHVGSAGHGYHRDGREAMLRFFNSVSGVRANGRERDIPTERPADLRAAPRGQVSNLPSNRPIHVLANKIFRQKYRKRRTLGTRGLSRTIVTLLNLPERPNVPHHRGLRPIRFARGAYTRGWCYSVETEPEIQSILYAWEMKPDGSRQGPPSITDATLYVPHLSSEEDIAAELCPVTSKLLYSIDVRGKGRSVPTTCGITNFFDAYGYDYFYAAHGLMLAECYLGRQVHDLLSSIDLLKAHGTRRVHLVGRGLGAILATFAGCIHPLVDRVTLRHFPKSFERMFDEGISRWPQSMMPFGVLQQLDLPDCYTALRTHKRLHLIEPWNAQMQIIN